MADFSKGPVSQSHSLWKHEPMVVIAHLRQRRRRRNTSLLVSLLVYMLNPLFQSLLVPWRGL